jgi:hypothetical protein
MSTVVCEAIAQRSRVSRMMRNDARRRRDRHGFRRHPAWPSSIEYNAAWSPSAAARERHAGETPMIRKLKSGEYRLYSKKKDPKTGKRRNLGTFKTRAAAEKHERAVQYFKRNG